MKMTPEQKAANKAAQKVRDRAFSARLREYRAAQRAAAEQVEASDTRRASNEMDAQMEAAMQERDAKCAAIQNQIDALGEKLKALKSRHHERIEIIRCARHDAWAAHRARLDEEQEKVNEVFSDVSGIFYVSQWKVPADVQVEMDAAARATEGA